MTTTRQPDTNRLRPLAVMQNANGMTAANGARLNGWDGTAQMRMLLLSAADAGLVHVQNPGCNPGYELFELTAAGRAALVAAGLMKPAQQPKKKV